MYLCYNNVMSVNLRAHFTRLHLMDFSINKETFVRTNQSGPSPFRSNSPEVRNKALLRAGMMASISYIALSIFACKFIYLANASQSLDLPPLFQHDGTLEATLPNLQRMKRKVHTEYSSTDNEYSDIKVEPLGEYEEVVAFSHVGSVTLDVTAAVVYTEVELQPIIDNWRLLENCLNRFTDILYEEHGRYDVAKSRTKAMELTLITQRMSRKLKGHWKLIVEVETLGLAQGVRPPRAKRSPLNAAFAFFSALSGIVSSAVTSQVLTEQGKLMDHLIEDQSQYSRAVENQAPQAESTLDFLNDTIASLKQYVGKENAEKRLDYIFYYGDRYTFFHDLLLYCQLLEEHMDEYISETNNYLNALLRTFQGVVDPLVFQPTAVREALEDLDQTKPDTLTLLFGSSNRDVSSFFRMKSTLVRTPSPNTFRVGVLLPLCNQLEQFDLFSVNAAPINPQGQDFEILFTIDKPFFITDRGRSYHRELSTDDLLNCLRVDAHYICPHIKILEKESTCLSVLFKGQSDEIYKHCSFSAREKRDTSIVKTGSQYLLTTQEPVSLYAKCGPQIPKARTSGVGQSLITLPAECSLDVKSQLVAASSNNSHFTENPKNLLIRLGSTTVYSMLQLKYPALEMSTPEGLGWIKEKVTLSGQPVPLSIISAGRGKLSPYTYVKSPVTESQVTEVLMWFGAIMIILWLSYLLWWPKVVATYQKVRDFLVWCNPCPNRTELDTVSYTDTEPMATLATLTTGPLESTRIDNTTSSGSSRMDTSSVRMDTGSSRMDTLPSRMETTRASDESESITVISEPTDEGNGRLRRTTSFGGTALVELLTKDLASNRVNRTT